MSQDLKQFNFKLPSALLEQLRNLATARNVTATELVIQGIKHVLGFKPENFQKNDIDLGIYQQLDNLEQRFRELVDYQSTVDIQVERRIKALEETVAWLEDKSLTIDIVPSPTKNISTQGITDKASTSTEEVESGTSLQNVVIDIVAELDENQSIEPNTNNTDDANLDSDVVVDIDKQLEQGNSESKPPTTVKNLVKAAQLELVNLEHSHQVQETIPDNAKSVNSIELLKILKSEDPQRNWDNDLLTNHRRFKNLKDQWHSAGNCQFKYTGKSTKIPGSSKNIHLWWVIRSNQSSAT